MRTKQLLTKLALLLVMLVGGGTAWATEDDVHDMEISQNTLLNNSASIPSINIAEQAYPVKAVTINWKYNKTISNPVTIEVLVGGTSWGSKTITGNTTEDAVFEGESTTGAIVINFTNNTGSGTGHGTFYVNSVKLTEGASGGPSYTITAESNNTDWGTVSLSGKVITATLADGASYADPAYTVSPDGSAIVAQDGNNFTVTPSADCTVTINFTAPPTYTVTFADGGSLTETSYGVGVTLPTRDAISDYAFAGWSETEVANETTVAPIIIPAGEYHPAGDITLYPVYSKTEGGGGNKTIDVSIASYASANNWANATQYSEVIVDDNITASAAGSSNTGKYYSTDNSWRFYSTENATLKFTASQGSITSITLTYSEGAFKYGDNIIKSGKAVSINNETNVEFACTTKAFVNSFSVTYTGGGTTYYWSSPVAAAVERPVITVADNPFFFSTTATITCGTAGASIKYSFDNATWKDYTAALTINETTTIYAKAINGSDESTVASVTATKNLAEPTVTIVATGITNTNVYEGTAAGSLTATVTYNDAAVEGAIVTWRGNNDEVATIDETTGAVTLVAAGKVTFTASFAGNADYNSATETYELTVTNSDPNAPGTENNPYTVAQAIDEIKAGKTGSYYVSGIISKISSTSVLSGGKLTYFISDDGTTNNQLQVYRGKNINNTEFTSVNDIAKGDKVVVYGPFTYYNSNTPELNDGNYLISLTKTPSITLSDNTINATAAEKSGTITVTYNNLTNYDSEVRFFASDGETAATYDWLDAKINTSDDTKLDYTIGENNNTEARTAYMKVYAEGDEGVAYSELITITQDAPVVTNTYTLATSFTSGKHYVIASGTNGDVKVMGSQNTNNRTSVDGNVSGTTLSVASDAGATEFIIYGPDVNGCYTIYDAAKGYLYAASSSNNYLRSQTALDDNGKWSISIDGSGEATVVAQGSNSNKYMRFNNTLFSCYGSNSIVTDLVYFYEKDGEATPTETIHVTDAKYATYCSENALDFEGTGLTAYVADQKGTSLTFEQVTKVPAYTGVLVKANAAGDYTISATSSIDGAKGSDLKGVIAETKITEAGIFVLMKGEKGVGFYKTTSTGFTVGAHTAYLPNTMGLSRDFIAIDEATAINGIAAEKASNGEIYNLQGQRVTKAQKGLYIMDGKKVLVK
ncbi:MAG: hypothetical protein IKH32_08400 [Prevotella sp.]|nr:hypothetical protein [Prevotella sp.]